jgi:hypothetical protein
MAYRRVIGRTLLAAPFGLYIPGQYIPPLTFGADLTVQF